MKRFMKIAAVVLSVALSAVSVIVLLFGSFGASLDAQAQTRISSEAAKWQADNGGFLLNTTVKLIDSAFENRLTFICGGIIVLLVAAIVAMRRKNSCLHIGISAAVSGGLITLAGLVLKQLFDFFAKTAPAVDWTWYKAYLTAFQNRLLLFGGITLVLGIVLIAVKCFIDRRGGKTDED